MPSGHHKNPRHASYSESGPNRLVARNLRVDKSREIDLLLDQSERQGLCLATKDRCLRKALLTRACAGMLVSPAPGLFARASHWHGLTPSTKSLHIMRGMHQLHPSWVFSHVSAAVAWGLSVPHRVQGLVHVATPADSHSRSSPTIKRHCIPPGLAPALVNGIPVTPLERTALDCMRSLGFQDGTAVGDSALRVGKMARDQLGDYVESQRGLRGIAAARDTAAFLDSRSANGGESIARATIHQLGFMAPELQVAFPDPIEPERSYFADYVWEIATARRSTSGNAPILQMTARATAPAAVAGYGIRHRVAGTCAESGFKDDMVIGELDGIDKIVDPDINGGLTPAAALIKERRRESRLSITRAGILRFSFQDVLDTALFNHMLEVFGIPRDHKPLVRIPPLLLPAPGPQADFGELAPVDVYGI